MYYSLDKNAQTQHSPDPSMYNLIPLCSLPDPLTDMGLMDHMRRHMGLTDMWRQTGLQHPEPTTAVQRQGLGPHTARWGTSVRVPRARAAGACQKPWWLPALRHSGHTLHGACCVASGTRVSLSLSRSIQTWGAERPPPPQAVYRAEWSLAHGQPRVKVSRSDPPAQGSHPEGPKLRHSLWVS